MSQIDEQEVYDTKKQLPNKKSEDNMGLSNYLIKKINPISTAKFTIILIQIIGQAVYPSCLKTAKVVPTFKEGDKSLPCNYRPLFFISCYRKRF